MYLEKLARDGRHFLRRRRSLGKRYLLKTKSGRLTAKLRLRRRATSSWKTELSQQILKTPRNSKSRRLKRSRKRQNQEKSRTRILLQMTRTGIPSLPELKVHGAST